MPPSARFVLLWAVVQAAAMGGDLLSQRWLRPLAVDLELSDAAWALLELRLLPLAFAHAWTESPILRSAGRPIPRWTLWLGLGRAAIAWAGSGLFHAWVRSASTAGWTTAHAWASAASLAAFDGLATAAVMGWAAWGRRWPPSWRLWLPLRMLVQLALLGVTYALPHGLVWAAGGVPSSLVVTMVSAAAHGLPLGAATAWLLWRLVLPTPAR